jgi:hypothetical protein
VYLVQERPVLFFPGRGQDRQDAVGDNDKGIKPVFAQRRRVRREKKMSISKVSF